jgi:hypothetical protein
MHLGTVCWPAAVPRSRRAASPQRGGCSSAVRFAAPGDFTKTERSMRGRGPLTTICGMPPDQVVEMVRLAASPSAADHDTLVARRSAILPVNSRFSAEAVARLLGVLHE